MKKQKNFGDHFNEIIQAENIITVQEFFNSLKKILQESNNCELIFMIAQLLRNINDINIIETSDFLLKKNL